MDCEKSNTDQEDKEEELIMLTEAASTLTELVTRKEVDGTNNGAATSTSTSTGGDSTVTSISSSMNGTPGTPGTQLHHDDELSKKSHVSVTETIKRAVLRRLGRPEDILKRNMFAVEGKSIKFPVKVSSQVLSLMSMICMLCL